MHFAHRLRTVWSWLPAFRAVAETEHLPTAAHELELAPSSLSRAVKQLEDDLGVPLFDRTNNLLQLNDAGRALLVAVREGMRVIDEALDAASSNELRGSVGAVAPSDLAQAVLIPAGAVLAQLHPALSLSMRVAGGAEATTMLLRGDADAAIVLLPPPTHPDLRTIELATWTRAVFTASSVGGSPRCIVVGTPVAHDDDGWPSTVERTVSAWVPDQRAALDLCARGGSVTVGFDALVRAYGYAERLVRLPAPEIPPCTLYIVHRRAVGEHRKTDALVAAMRDVVHSM